MGRVADTYFDDEKWIVRYLIVKTSDWLHVHQVMISPLAVTSLDWFTRVLITDLSRAQIESSPGIDTDTPVSRQQENDSHRYGYPWYWEYTGGRMWSGAAPVVRPTDEQRIWAARRRLAGAPKGRKAAPHLRSCRQVMGYRIEASDASIGHIEDFLFDRETWALRYAVVHIRNWLWGKRVLISPERILSVNCSERSLLVDMRSDAVRDSPAYNPDRLLRRAPSTRG